MMHYEHTKQETKPDVSSSILLIPRELSVRALNYCNSDPNRLARPYAKRTKTDRPKCIFYVSYI